MHKGRKQCLPFTEVISHRSSTSSTQSLKSFYLLILPAADVQATELQFRCSSSEIFYEVLLLRVQKRQG